jgi:hypothetical protein
MATGAGHVCMRSGQRKVRFIVIESHIIPTCGRMTGRTIIAKLALMRVALFMTRIAIHRRALENIVNMTRCTGNAGMSSS